jgi:hypothetical protein
MEPWHASLPDSSPEQARGRAALLDILSEMRRAHFTTDVALLLAHDADPLLVVCEGEIKASSRAEMVARFTDNFRGATYQEWDYVEQPIIRMSDDASIAWAISRVRVRRTIRRPGDTEDEQRFIYAGVDTYERRGESWVHTANVSTFAEE